MITLQLGRWCHKAGRLFIHERVYTNTGKWTPICITHFRHVGSEPALPPEPPKEETVNEITPEMIEAAERNEKRIKERVDRIYDELIAEKRAEIERLEAEIAKMPPFDAEKLAANPIAPPKEFII
jgi:hypothetical protein